MNDTHRRHTKYTDEIARIIAARGHASNAEIATDLRKVYPDVSDTTVHRVTARMLEDGVVAFAPKTQHGSVRYDASLEPHDHFHCNHCDGLKDVCVPDAIRNELGRLISGCIINGQLTVSGDCHQCISKRRSK